MTYPLDWVVACHQTVAFVKPGCYRSAQLITLLYERGLEPYCINVDALKNSQRDDVLRRASSMLWPQVWHNERYVGDLFHCQSAILKNKL
jgi:glutaredoxin